MRHFLVCLAGLLGLGYAAAADCLLYEGFEAGSIANGWTVSNTAGSTAWTVEDTTAVYPAGTFAGTYRASFRNRSGVVNRSVSRLVSPAVDLSQTDRAVLRFAYAMPSYVGDVDTLRVYYRSSAGSRWVMLAQMDKAVPAWQTSVIELPATTAAYQVMFEATDNLGRGIALDDICITNLTECQTPDNLNITRLEENRVSLTWNASLAADSFRVVISTNPISTSPSLTPLTSHLSPLTCPVDTIVYDFSFASDSVLTRNTDYYIYISAYCRENISDWGMTTFSTPYVVRIRLPYAESFDRSYAAGVMETPEGWTCASQGGQANPFINRSTPVSRRYLYSADSTTTLSFAAGSGLSLPVPAGVYAYAATPVIEASPLTPLSVSFRATGSNLLEAAVGSQVVVGMMSSPQSLATFIPLDTVQVDCINQYRTFHLRVDGSANRGRYLAFVSRSAKANAIFIDQLTITEATLPQVPTHLTCRFTAADRLTASVRTHEADSVRFRVSIADSTIYKGVKGVRGVEGITFDCWGLHGRWMDVSAQAWTDGRASGWTDPRRVFVPCAISSYPAVFDFENNCPNAPINNKTVNKELVNTFADLSANLRHLGLMSNYTLHAELMQAPLPPRPEEMIRLVSTEAMDGTHAALLPQQGRCLVFPRLTDGIGYDALLLTCYLRSTNGGSISIGVMDDPADASTFHAVTTHTATDRFRLCAATFENYQGSGRYVAIRANTTANLLIDQVVIDSTYCWPPLNVAATATDTSVTLTWKAGRESHCRTILSRNADLSNPVIPNNKIINQETVNTIAYTGLRRNTTYYYTVINDCEHTTYQGDTMSIRTECGRVPLPYTEDFDSIEAVLNRPVTPDCWAINHAVYGTTNATYYPYVQSLPSGAHSGKQFLSFGKPDYQSTRGNSIAALPLMAERVNAMQLELWARTVNLLAPVTLQVGTLPSQDQLTAAAFEAFDTIVVPADSKYHRIVVDFSTCQSTNDHIALMTREGANVLYVDDLSLDHAPACEEVTRVSVRGETGTGADISWRARRNNRWEVVVSTDSRRVDDEAFQAASIAASFTVSQSSKITVSTLNPNTQYYVSVRSLCDGSAGRWTEPEPFKTTCTQSTLPYVEDFEGMAGGFSTDIVPDCWKMTRIYYQGRYLPFVYNSRQNAYDGTKSLFFGVDNTAVNQDLYAVLPEMPDDISRLELTLYARAFKAALPDTLLVGTMADDDDFSTFSVYDTVPVTEATYKRKRVIFDHYTGSDRHIAFMKKAGNTIDRRLYVDRITVDHISTCDDIKSVKIDRFTPSGATFTPSRVRSDEWQYVLTREEVRIEAMSASDSLKVVVDTVTRDYPFTLSHPALMPGTIYYLYARSRCNGSNAGEWSDAHAFKTQCTAATPEQLDTMSFSTAESVNCWTLGLLHGTNGAPLRHPAGYLHFGVPTDADNAYAILPPLELDDIRRYQMSFDLWTTVNSPLNNRRVDIGVATNPEDLSTYTRIHTVIAEQGTPEKARRLTVRFDRYEGDFNGEMGKFIVFTTETGDSVLYADIDNVCVDTIASCREPVNLRVTDVGATTVSVAWDGEGMAYEASLLREGESEPSVYPLATREAACTLSGLESPRTYRLRLRSACAVGDTSRWSEPLTFTTTCRDIMPLPYVETFERYESGLSIQPDCWTTYYGPNANGVYPCIEPAANAYRSNRSLNIHQAGYGTSLSAAALPRFELPASGLTLSFHYRSNMATAAAPHCLLVVGVAQDVSSAQALNASFLPLDTIVSRSEEYTEYERDLTDFDLPAQVNNDCRIVLRAAYGDSCARDGSVFVDDLQVRRYTPCRQPKQVQVTDATANSMDISWTQKGGVQGWQVGYRPAALTADTLRIINVPALTQDICCTIGGLMAGVDYEIRVRATCGEDGMSDWSDAIVGSTDCVADVPVLYDFDIDDSTYPINGTGRRMQNCWTVYNTDSRAPVDYVPQLVKNGQVGTADEGTVVARSGQNALLMNVYYGYSPAYAVLPLAYGGVGPLALRFKVRAITHDEATSRLLTNAQTTPYAHSFKVGLLSAPGNAAGFTTLVDYHLPDLAGTNYTDTDPNRQDYWEEVVVPLNSNTLGASYPAFMLDLPDGSLQNRVYIDDVSIERAPANGLYKPYNFALDSISTTAAALHWSEMGTATAWQVSATVAGQAADSGMIYNVNGSPNNQIVNQKTVNGLLPSTDYHFYVRSCSGSEVSEWYGPVAGSTQCVYDLPFCISFDDADRHYAAHTLGNATYLMERCWTSNNQSTISPAYCPYLVSDTASAHRTSLKLYTTLNYPGATAVMPLVDADLDTLVLSLDLRAGSYDHDSRTFLTYATDNYAHSIQVGTVDDMDAPGTFRLIHTYRLPDITANVQTDDADYGWVRAKIPLRGARGRYLALRSGFDLPNHVYVDSVSLLPASDECYVPTSLTLNVQTFNARQVDFSWSSDAGKWDVYICCGQDTLANTQVDTPAFHYEGLTDLTDYRFAVRSRCDSVLTEWSVLDFTTPCPVYDFEGSYWSFDGKTHSINGSNSYFIPVCWDSDNARSSQTYSKPYIVQNSDRTTVARDEARTGHALFFYGINNVQEGYAVMPSLDVDLDSAMLHFYGRAAQFNSRQAASNPGMVAESNTGYSRKLVVGTITDPHDFSTFEPLDTLTYDHLITLRTTVDSDPSGNSYWQEYALPLSRYKRGRIAIVQAAASVKTYFYIDDVAILPVGYCAAPIVSVDSITSESACLHWTIPTGDNVARVQLSTREVFRTEDLLADFVSNDTMQSTIYNQNNLKLNGLASSTTYHYRVGHVCEGMTDYVWTTGSFITNARPRYREEFSRAEILPPGWTVCTGNAQGIMRGASIHLAEQKRWGIHPSNSFRLPAYHLMGEIYRENNENDMQWAIGPAVDLRLMPDTAHALLSFDLALTSNSGGLPSADLPDEEMMVFALPIEPSYNSAFNFQTSPLPSPLLVWNNTGTGTHAFSSLTTQYVRYHADLSQYIGRQVRIAFYIRPGSRDVNAHEADYVHIDNVQVNRSVQTIAADTACALSDYDGYGFSLSADQLHVGRNLFTQAVTSMTDDQPDQFSRLNLQVRPTPMSRLDTTVCAGQPLVTPDFVIADPQSGEYRRKFDRQDGCDSVVSLRLRVIPAQHVDMEEHICEGQAFHWKGRDYYTSALLTDTLVSSTGCDSVVNIHLQRLPRLEGNETVMLCHQDTLRFYGRDISAAGSYQATIPSSVGCDSVVTWQVVALPILGSNRREVICHGSTYTDHNFVGLSMDGTYRLLLRSEPWGCDSTVVLRLLVADERGIAYDTIAPEELPYTIGSEELLGSNATAGRYTLTAQAPCGNVSINLCVGTPSGLPEVSPFSSQVSIFPNPVTRGSLVSINCPAGIAAVSLYNGLGQIESTLGRLEGTHGRFESTHGQIENKGIANTFLAPATSGPYLLRITDTTGNTHTAKLIVQ